MISEKVVAALNEHLTYEFYSSYLYMSMAGYFETQSLGGFSHWMRIQAQEEASHAMIFFNYICDQEGRVALGAVKAPQHDFKSPAHVFETTIAHEKDVTARIHKLVDLCIQERDHATKTFLEWFVKEQVEEVATDKAMLEQLRRAGESIFLLDKDAGTRTFTQPQPLAGRV